MAVPIWGQMMMQQGASQFGKLEDAIVGAATAKWADKRQIRQQRKLMRMGMGAEKNMARFNQDLALDMWDKTNYSAQMGQMKKAGLNPGLMYGGAGSGGTTSGAGSGNAPSAGEAPKGGGEMGMAMQIGAATRMQNAQIAMMEAQKQNTEADTELKKSQVPKTGAETESTQQNTENAKLQGEILKIDRQIKEVEANIQGETKETIIATLNAQKEKLQAEASSASTEANVSKATEEEQVKQRGEGATLEQQTRIAAQKSGIKVNDAQIKKMAADITKQWSEIDKMWADNKIDKAEVELKKKQILLQKAQIEFNTSTAAQIKQWTDIVMPLIQSGLKR